MKILCVIPARKNSKRLINKNFKILKGKPLISWTLELAQKVKSFNEIVLSSDNQQILKLNKKYPKIHFLKRPPKISQDNTAMSEVIKHAILYFKNRDTNFDAIVVLQPTSPLRQVKTINSAINMFKKLKPDFLASIKKVKHNQQPDMMVKISNLKRIHKTKINVKRSINKSVYYSLDGGVIFIFNILNKNFKLEGKGAFVEVKFPESIDVDDIYDFETAKKFINYETNKNWK